MPDGSELPLRVAMTVEQCWQKQPGGSGTYVRELSAELARRADLQLTGIAAHHASSAVPDGGPLPQPVRHLALPRSLVYRSWQSLRLPRVDRGHDVVHATTWAIPGRRLPLVVTVHDLAFLDDPSHFTAHGTAYFRRGLELVRREAAEVIVPSTTTRDACIAQGIAAERITVIPHGVREAHVTDRDVARFREQHSLDRPYVLWVGTREPRKNLRRLVEAYERALTAGLDADLVLVGPDGWGSAEDRLAGGTADRVHVLGRLPREQLDAAYADCLLFCYPSLREGYGMPVTEAMARGAAVVTSRGTATEEAAGGAGILVDPTDVDDMAAGITAAAEPERRLSLQTAARERARGLSWAAAAEATVAVLRRAAGR